MKIKAILLLAGLFAVAAFSQTTTVVQTPEYIWRVQISQLTHDSNGQPTSVPVEVFYRSDVLNGTEVIAQAPSEPSNLTVDVAANGAKTVTFAGQTYSYGQGFAIMSAIFAQERATQLAAIAAAKAAALAAKTSTPSTP